MTEHVRLPVYDSTDLSKVSYSLGDIVADRTNNTVRLMDGATPGGIQLLRADLKNATAGAGVTVGDTPPSSPTLGSMWFNSATGALYIYYIDPNGGQWVQPVAAPGQVYVPPAYTLPTATTSTLGGVIADGSTITVSPTGVITFVNSTSFVNSSFVNTATLRREADAVTLNSSAGLSTITYNWSSDNSVYYQTGLTGNYTAAFTNLPTINNRVYTVNITITQGATGYYPTAVSVNGSTYVINWVNGTAPTPSSNFTDTVSFTFLYVNNTWSVIGNLTNYKTLGH
jgi:hypothetical protein